MRHKDLWSRGGAWNSLPSLPGLASLRFGRLLDLEKCRRSLNLSTKNWINGNYSEWRRERYWTTLSYWLICCSHSLTILTISLCLLFCWGSSICGARRHSSVEYPCWLPHPSNSPLSPHSAPKCLHLWPSLPRCCRWFWWRFWCRDESSEECVSPWWTTRRTPPVMTKTSDPNLEPVSSSLYSIDIWNWTVLLIFSYKIF